MTYCGAADAIVWTSSCSGDRALSRLSVGAQGDLWVYRFRGCRMELLCEGVRPIHMTSTHNK